MRSYRFRQPVVEMQPRPPARDATGSRRHGWAAPLAAMAVAGSGLLNLISLIGGPAPAQQPRWMAALFPLDFTGIARTLTLLCGFALLLAAVYLWAQKRRAWQTVMVLSGASAVVHLARGGNLQPALGSAALLGLLWLGRRAFTVGSERVLLGTAARRAAYAMAVAAAYGTAGFWLLEPSDFHRNFHWWDAALRTFRLMLFLGDQSLVPHTPYAAWFLDSLYSLSATAFFYSGLVLFRPVVYRFRADSDASIQARAIAERHGRTGQDFFKHFPDKSYYFSPNRQSFLGYRVSGDYALVLGDPVGPEEELAATVAGFRDFCRKRGWRVGFHQVSARHLPAYAALGFRRLKVGDDAIVDLEKFTLSGSAMKEFRNTVNRLDRLGYRVERRDPPLPGPLLEDLERISSRWLEIPGHRERQFTLGRFERSYVRSTAVYVAFDAQSKPVAFLNLVPSYDPHLATVDLMRRESGHINGLMDYLFAKAFLDLKARGVRSFSLGMAPLSGTGAEAAAGKGERVAHWAMRRMPFLFRTDSLRRFKAKYADSWQPLYAVYQGRFDLPRLALALRRISESAPQEWRRAA